jgi:damage-control phosphatase, subfamily I
MKASLDCMFCMIKRNDEIYSQYEENEEKRIAFVKTVMSIISKSSPSDSAPLISTKVVRALSKITNIDDHYIDEKKYSNNLILKMENKIIQNIDKADDKLISAIQYSLAGNYIDFGAMSHISDDSLKIIIDKSHEFIIDENIATRFKSDLKSAKSLVYLTDNAGEIVFDKLLIQTIMKLYPNVKINAIVRGYPIYNDATMQDALSVGLTDMVDVCDNGFDAPGTVLTHINKKSGDLINQADLIISKGMGNFETLYGCKKNIYYSFLCKCAYFTKRFGMKQFESVFKNEADIEF